MMEQLEAIIGDVSNFILGPPLLFLVVGTGLFLTFRLGFLQFRMLPYSLPTLIGLLGLSNVVVAETKKFLDVVKEEKKQKREGSTS
jgi:Na+/alanine symporter